MSLYNGPARGGTRGGRDQFNWDSVKSDKDRECYLGHSLMAPVGRWQKGKDLLWYAKGAKDEEQALQDELRAVKQREENAMLEALGLKPKSQPTAHAPMDKKEVDELLRRSKEDREEAGEQGERVQGLGFAPAMQEGVAHREVMAGEGLPQGGAGGGGGPPARGVAAVQPESPRDRKRQRSDMPQSKAEKKAAKKAKKAEKKERKAEKKAEKKRRKEG